jgi:hypothetical protein
MGSHHRHGRSDLRHPRTAICLQAQLRGRQKPRKKTPLNALGPSLLAAIAVVAIMPDLRDAAVDGVQPFASYLVSLLATLAVLRLSKSAGLALMIGVACYALCLSVAGVA